MIKRKVGLITALLLVVALSVPLVSSPAVLANGVEIQVAMILDSSGSIDAGEWAAMVTGLATAVNDTQCMPHDGSVELTVIQFSQYAQLEVGPVVIADAATAATVANDIMNISPIGGTTCISCGFCLAADTLVASPNFDTSLKQAINLVTDGEPNECSCYGGSCNYTWGSCGGLTYRQSAECARNYTIATLGMTSNQDEIDAEAIGITVGNRDWLKNNIIFPATGYSNPPEAWPPPGPGWVRVFTTFEEFVPSVCEKFAAILEPPPVGWEVFPTDKAAVMAPWIVVAVLLAGGAGWYVLRRRTVQR